MNEQAEKPCWGIVQVMLWPIAAGSRNGKTSGEPRMEELGHSLSFAPGKGPRAAGLHQNAQVQGRHLLPAIPAARNLEILAAIKLLAEWYLGN